MIVSCPACSARFRLDRQRLGGKRITLRCTRCRTTFKAEIPSVPGNSSRIRIAVGHEDPALCGTIRELVTAEGMECGICHDAESLLRLLQAAPPHVAIIDVAIPGSYIFEVMDKIRIQPQLADMRILLLSSVYNRMAYKRHPSSLYGADDYIEKHHLPDDLVAKIFALTAKARPALGKSRGEEVISGQADEAEEKGESRRQEALKSEIFASEQAAGEGGESAEKARRLARIIVADIALYSQEKVEEGIRHGTFYQLLAHEIQEGRKLFAERIAPELREGHDYLQEAFAAFIQRRRIEMRISN